MVFWAISISAFMFFYLIIPSTPPLRTLPLQKNLPSHAILSQQVNLHTTPINDIIHYNNGETINIYLEHVV